MHTEASLCIRRINVPMSAEVTLSCNYFYDLIAELCPFYHHHKWVRRIVDGPLNKQTGYNAEVGEKEVCHGGARICSRSSMKNKVQIKWGIIWMIKSSALVSKCE